MTRVPTAVLVIVVGLVPSVASAQDRPPNVLFIFTDDQHHNTIRGLGNTAIHTPNLDRLVERGTAFTTCYIQGSIVDAVCASSRAMLLTGRSLYRAPLGPRKDHGYPLWPQVFRDAGYETFGTGKWHNGPEAFTMSFSAGAKIFFGGMHMPEDGGHARPRVVDYKPGGDYRWQDEYAEDVFSTELFSNAAIEFIENHNDDRPFFCYLSYTAPHDPRMAPDEYVDMYDPAEIELPANFMPSHPFDNGDIWVRDEWLESWPRTEDAIRKHIAEYYAMITHLDAHIGRVLDALESSGHADDTIILFASDNGLAVGRHGLMGKQNLYEHSLRVPLVMAGPGIPAGKRVDRLVYLHDLYPTVCELAAVPVPDTVESHSLVSLLGDEGGKVHDSIFGAYRAVQRSVRDERYKLIRYPDGGEVQLFDLRADPFELDNLADDADHGEQVEDLDALLRRWQQRLDDPIRLPPLTSSR